VLLFAHRGGRRHAPENTLAAFRGALTRGATGLESDVRLSADGVPVLVHDARPRRRLRRITVAETPRRALPTAVPTLAELYAAVGSAVPLSLDVKDVRAAAPTLEVAREAGALAQLWLCGSLPDLRHWRALDPTVRLVLSTSRELLDRDRAGALHELRLLDATAVNLRDREWDGDLVAAVRTAGLLTLGWDAHTRRRVRRLAELGLDGAYGDDVDALLAGSATAR